MQIPGYFSKGCLVFSEDYFLHLTIKFSFSGKTDKIVSSEVGVLLKP